MNIDQKNTFNIPKSQLDTTLEIINSSNEINEELKELLKGDLVNLSQQLESDSFNNINEAVRLPLMFALAKSPDLMALTLITLRESLIKL